MHSLKNFSILKFQQGNIILIEQYYLFYIINQSTISSWIPYLSTLTIYIIVFT